MMPKSTCAASMLTTKSPLSRSMPFTPPALRPMGRTSVSRNRMAWPSWLARKIICLPSVSFAPINSSLSSRLMAMMPVERGLENSISVDFFTAPLFFQVARSHQRRQLLVFLEFHQARNRLAARGCRGFRQFVHFQPVDAPLRREQQNIAVRGSDEEVFDEILFLRS